MTPSAGKQQFPSFRGDFGQRCHHPCCHPRRVRNSRLLLVVMMMGLLVLPTFNNHATRFTIIIVMAQTPTTTPPRQRQRRQQQPFITQRVHYGYFTEARPIHTACARGWFDVYLTGDETSTRQDTMYRVTCYPQSSGNYAVSKLDATSDTNTTNHQLDIANLGSTPLAQALSRGVNLQVIYITQYMGDSQGIYVRSDLNINTPFDLMGHTIGVPFGSTMHYQLLFLLDLLHIDSMTQVQILNLSPTEIIQYWKDGTIDAAACWGTARDYLLDPNTLLPAKTLMSSSVLADWGRPTSTVVAVTRSFAKENQAFLTHFVHVLSDLADSYLDRLGQNDIQNIPRWDTINSAVSASATTNLSSYVPSMVDALLLRDEIPGRPSQTAINHHRRGLSLFVQQSAKEQLSCSYLGPGFVEGQSNSCTSPTLQHIATRETSIFLQRQKIIATLGPILENMGDDFDCRNTTTFCGSDIFDGQYLQPQKGTTCKTLHPCSYPIGSYAILGARTIFRDRLLSELERYDFEKNRLPFAGNEIDRSGTGNSIPCPTVIEIKDHNYPIIGSFGDGANAENGKSYSDNLNCHWVIRGTEYCNNDNEEEDNSIILSPPLSSSCQNHVLLEFQTFKVWSGDFVRVYTDPIHHKCNPGSQDNILLGQLSGFYSLPDDNEGGVPDIPPFRSKGCILVQFETDPNQERSYGDIENLGDGFSARYQRNAQGCFSSDDCSGFPCDSSQRICLCGGHNWGSDCSKRDSCLGLTRIILKNDNEEVTFSSSSNPLEEGSLYPNDLDCTFQIEVSSQYYAYGNGPHMIQVNLTYDLEETYDLLTLYSGSSSGSELNPYAILTNSNYFHNNDNDPTSYTIWTNKDGKTTLHLTTDARGRRKGFLASAQIVAPNTISLDDSYYNKCDIPGQSGNMCEFDYCIAENRFALPMNSQVDARYEYGRVVSQIPGLTVRPMPWSLDGGCVWPLHVPPVTDHLVAIRLVFHIPLDLEPRPSTTVGGDTLLVRTFFDDESTFFVEECDSDEVCSYPWQTGVCDVNVGGCKVRTTLEVPVKSLAGSSIRLITDRNDGGQFYKGLDFEVLSVMECPSAEGREHCEAANGGTCGEDGYCICKGGVPCTCPCDGSPPNTIGLKVGVVFAVIVPLFCIFVGIFLRYRRRKILQSRAQKDVIKAKEAELEAFRNSIVGLRTAVGLYVPKIAILSDQGSDVEMGKPSRLPSTITPTLGLKVQWCWKETPFMMKNHNNDVVVGDPADCWIKYDMESNTKLEEAYQKQNRTGYFQPLAGYRVNLDTMIQTKLKTGFERHVQRVVDNTAPVDTAATESGRTVDLEQAQVGSSFPSDLLGEPQMVLVEGDVIQISKQRSDGWAFGTKLHHADEAVARTIVKAATDCIPDGDTAVFTDTGWFEMGATRVPTGDDLSALQTSVGETSLDAPSYWDPVSDPAVAEQHVLPDNQERRRVVDAFMTSLKPPNFHKQAQVVKVTRIQNLAMWQSYIVKRQSICYREVGQQGADNVIQRRALERFERAWLWHGTNLEMMHKILQQGFNRSFCGKNATMYGKGVYFARDTAYSAHPIYAVPDRHGNQYMLACRVVVGEYCRGKMDALTPDVRDVATNSLFDSTVGLLGEDTMADPSIYVTYHDAQAYPEVSFTESSSRTILDAVGGYLTTLCQFCSQYLIQFRTS